MIVYKQTERWLPHSFSSSAERKLQSGRLDTERQAARGEDLPLTTPSNLPISLSFYVSCPLLYVSPLPGLSPSLPLLFPPSLRTGCGSTVLWWLVMTQGAGQSEGRGGEACAADTGEEGSPAETVLSPAPRAAAC